MMVNEMEEEQNKDATVKPHESSCRETLEDVGGVDGKVGRTNEENGEAEPNPSLQATDQAVCPIKGEVDHDHAIRSDNESNGKQGGKKATGTEEETKPRKNCEHADVVEKRIMTDEAGNEEIMKNEESVLMGEEEKGNNEAECPKEEKSGEKEETHEAVKCTQAESHEPTATGIKAEAQENKITTADKPEKTKSRSGMIPSSSVPRVSTQASRQRGARTSARRDAMAKFQQDQTPAVRNFKVQKVSVGVSGGNTIKQKILQWCSSRTRGYEGVSIENFSSSWSNGLAFCALVHHFFPSAFDFSTLKASEREKNFTLAFSMAESLADCCPLLDVSDMVLMGSKPDPFSVFTYVQSLCQHLSKIERERKEQEKAEEMKKEAENKADKKEANEGDAVQQKIMDEEQTEEEDIKQKGDGEELVNSEEQKITEDRAESEDGKNTELKNEDDGEKAGKAEEKAETGKDKEQEAENKYKDVEKSENTEN